MAKGLSLHIGLNLVDPNHYSGWDGQLFGCEPDANAMEALAKSVGYETRKLLTKQATRSAVQAALSGVAKELSAGDIFLLTFSGHGGQVPDLQGEETDGMDETWCLYDAQIVDDELSECYAEFADGVRIVVLSDSCHSGTVSRAPINRSLSESGLRSAREPAAVDPTIRFRNMPIDVALRVFHDNPDTYIPIVEGLPAESERRPVSASVRLISACQDNQLAADGAFNGLFTGTLLQVWRRGAFQGDYAKFHRAILDRLPSTQSPNHIVVGKQDLEFNRQHPFSIAGASIF